MNPLIETNTRALNSALLLLRLMAGLILFGAGAGKVFGWFGGFGMTATIEMFKTNLHLSAFGVYVSSYTEFVGGLLIMVGLLTRVAAFALSINMLAATLYTGFAKFFLGGAAYPCLLFVICQVILLTGPMAYSIDAFLSNRQKTENFALKLNAAF